MPPGRSGEEFIARLIELERFAEGQEVFNPDGYAGSAEEKPSISTVLGRINEEHRFKPVEKFSAVRPYRGLDVSRLKLSGEGSGLWRSSWRICCGFLFKSRLFCSMESQFPRMDLILAGRQRLTTHCHLGLKWIACTFSSDARSWTCMQGLQCTQECFHR